MTQQDARMKQQERVQTDGGRVARIVRRLLRLQERIEPMRKGCIVIDFAGDRETIRVTEVMED